MSYAKDLLEYGHACARCAELGAALEINSDPRGWPVRFTVENITLCPPCRYA